MFNPFKGLGCERCLFYHYKAFICYRWNSQWQRNQYRGTNNKQHLIGSLVPQIGPQSLKSCCWRGDLKRHIWVWLILTFLGSMQHQLQKAAEITMVPIAILRQLLQNNANGQVVQLYKMDTRFWQYLTDWILILRCNNPHNKWKGVSVADFCNGELDITWADVVVLVGSLKPPLTMPRKSRVGAPSALVGWGSTNEQCILHHQY